MTYRQTTTPNTDTVTASQPCDDDPFGLNDIPTFLRRMPKPAESARAGRDK